MPSDAENAGSIFFNFSEAVARFSIDLVDFSSGASGLVTLTNVDGDERVFTVPEEFTFDIADELDFAKAMSWWMEILRTTLWKDLQSYCSATSTHKMARGDSMTMETQYSLLW